MRRLANGVVLAALGLVVVVGVAAVLWRMSGGSDGDGGSCYADAAARIPVREADDELFLLLQGGSPSRAGDNGVVLDGSVEETTGQLLEHGLSADPLAAEAMAISSEQQMPAATAGYDLGQVSCWVAPLNGRSFAAEGSFDPERVHGSELGVDGMVSADNDRLAYDEEGDAAAWLQPAHEVDLVSEALLRVLDEQDVADFVIMDMIEDDGLYSGVGQAPGDSGGDWDLVVVWHFDDSEAAEAGLDRLETVLGNGVSTIPDIVDGDPLDHLERSGEQLMLRAPLHSPGQWMQLHRMFDSALVLNTD